MIGVIFMPTTFTHFVVVFVRSKRIKPLILINYLISLTIAVTVYSSLYARKGGSFFVFPYWPLPGKLFFVHLTHFLINLIYSYFLIFWTLKHSKGLFKGQVRYVLLGTIIGFLGGLTNYFYWYRIGIPPVFSISISLGVSIITFGIIRHRLMDISVTITRTGIFVTLYTLVLGLPFVLATLGKSWLISLLGANWWVGPLTLMAALATAGPFIYIFLQSRAEAILLKEQRRYQETLKQAAVGMTRIREMNKLLNLIVHIVTKTVRISHSGIYLLEPKSERFILRAGRNLKKSLPTLIDKNSSLIVWLLNQKEPMVYEEIRRKAQDTPTLILRELETQMRALDASVLVPSFLEDRLLALLILGDKRSGAIYTTEDLDVFSVLASQAALAIENAQFIQEAQVMQEQIAQAEKMATVGTMADGLSHQINNRLHALSMITGDTLDTLKLTDAGSFPNEAKEVLKQIAHALERIQANVIQGRDVVSGLLKYSRKGEEGLSAVTMDEIIDGALEMVKFKVKLSEIDLVRDYPSDLPKIKANLTQLQEVFFNLIDNAYDAIQERKDSLKEPDYRGRITITLGQSTDSSLKIVFADNGMGLRKEDRRKVFTPFFTTKVSSRRGTGLGLFVIQRIVTQMHQGKIHFESEQGKGTRFILELPIAK
jgi:signal transduction histidine kinase